jgi:enamine deaminase RidA (YjgF/YER057c/UK114 family)
VTGAVTVYRSQFRLRQRQHARPTGTAHLPTARTVRERMLQGAAPASTLLFVAGLASPEWLVEIEAIAAAT